MDDQYLNNNGTEDTIESVPSESADIKNPQEAPANIASASSSEELNPEQTAPHQSTQQYTPYSSTYHTTGAYQTRQPEQTGYGTGNPQAYSQGIDNAPPAYTAPNSPYGNATGNNIPPTYNSRPYTPGMAPPPQPGRAPYPMQGSGAGAAAPAFAPAPVPKSGKGNKLGKTIFITLVCVCLVIASISIGFAVRDENKQGGSKPFGSAATEKSGGSDNNLTENSDAPSLTISQTPIPSGTASGAGLSASEIYSKVKSINVGVLVYSNNTLAGEGSGVLWAEDATGTYTYIITCAHVISDSGISVRIQFEDDSDIEAEVIGYDTKTDIGVIRIKKSGLPHAEFGDVSVLSVGQTVYAIGNPGGTEFFGSFTSGMISAMDRPVDSTVGYSQPCIQHNAAINPGNSGGALINEYGQVIGINSSKIADTEYEGMGFAVPINTVKDVVDELVAHGYVTNRPKLGISYSPVSYSQIFSIIVQANNLPAGSIIIREIASDSDLNNKNVQVNDLIIKANGQELTTVNTLPEMIDDLNVGDKITLTICRINNDYSINDPFDVEVELIEDRGSTVVSEEEETTMPFFNPFGY